MMQDDIKNKYLFAGGDPNELIPMYDYEENNINIEEIRLINGRTEIPVDEVNE